MRITGGTLKGRLLGVPATDMRPTQERVREALFSSLGDQTPGARVLDLFAGSGAVGLEAWSRGAVEVHWVEKDQKIMRVLRQNVVTLCGDQVAQCGCHVDDALSFIGRGLWDTDKPFDLVFSDPPYDATGELKLLEKTLELLFGSSLLAATGLLVYEQSTREAVCEMSGWHLWKNKTYGSTRLLMYTLDHREQEKAG